MPRVFVALSFPHDVCDAIARDARVLNRYDPLARFVPSQNLHLTLAFLGEVPLARARLLAAALRPLAVHTPREIALGRVGTFDRSRVLWVDLSPWESLTPVVHEVRSVLQRLELSYDTKPFKAHITLARDWRRGVPPVSLPNRKFPLLGPMVFESTQDPRTNAIRYRQILP
ncbi:MAG: RNA 2',3'-cyclic phosphodiesterase [Sutterella sp.]|nr:RNA 2',3'-cyclic phosphodiesterase [Sutterella sp.]